MAKAKELNKYTKAEIIWALGQKYDFFEERFGRNEISSLISSIEMKRSTEALKKQEKIFEEARKTRDAYFNFLGRMREKYGNEQGMYHLGRLSEEELNEGCELEARWIRARDKEMEELKRI